MGDQLARFLTKPASCVQGTGNNGQGVPIASFRILRQILDNRLIVFVTIALGVHMIAVPNGGHHHN